MPFSSSMDSSPGEVVDGEAASRAEVRRREQLRLDRAVRSRREAVELDFDGFRPLRQIPFDADEVGGDGIVLLLVDRGDDEGAVRHGQRLHAERTDDLLSHAGREAVARGEGDIPDVLAPSGDCDYAGRHGDGDFWRVVVREETHGTAADRDLRDSRKPHVVQRGGGALVPDFKRVVSVHALDLDDHHQHGGGGGEGRVEAVVRGLQGVREGVASYRRRRAMSSTLPP